RRVLGRAAALAVTALALGTVGIAAASVTAWSEMLFLALTTVALAGLADLTRAEGAQPIAGDSGAARTALGSGLGAGLAALPRYIGWLLPALGVVLLLRARAPRRVVASWALPALALPAGWAARDVALFGHPMGPGLPPATLSLATVVRGALTALHWG